jgi:hypothetical protein
LSVAVGKQDLEGPAAPVRRLAIRSFAVQISWMVGDAESYGAQNSHANRGFDCRGSTRFLRVPDESGSAPAPLPRRSCGSSSPSDQPRRAHTSTLWGRSRQVPQRAQENISAPSRALGLLCRKGDTVVEGQPSAALACLVHGFDRSAVALRFGVLRVPPLSLKRAVRAGCRLSAVSCYGGVDPTLVTPTAI